MQIRSLDIDLSNIPKSGQARNIDIFGEINSSFILQVVDNTGKFYDFVNNTFVNGHIPRCNFRNTLSGNKTTVRVVFPSVASTTVYNVILIADPSTDTSIVSNKQNINKFITQVADTAITFAFNTSNSGNYAASPPSANVVKTLSNTSKKSSKVNISTSVTNNTSASGGFGLKLDRQPVDTDLVFIATTTLDGTTSSSTTMLVDSLTDISAGMFLVSGSGVSGEPVVTKVEDNLNIGGAQKKRITLSTAQTLTSDGGTYTFHAKGGFGISKATGVFISKPIIEATVPKTGAVLHTIRSLGGTATAGSDATLALDATYGIGKTASISGPGLASGLTVSSISAGSPSTSNGTIEMSSAQNLSGLEGSGVGFVVKFGDFVTQIDISINFNILSPGLNDRTITLLLDNFITPGVAS